MFFTADNHFGHTNIIKHCNRPFSSVEEMDEHLIERWNEKIPRKANVWHLGDFSFRSSKKVEKYFKRLNGNIKFILGNHDTEKELKKLAPVYIRKQIKYQGYKIILDHYSLRSWNARYHGSWHLFGHSHGMLPPLGKSMDVGVDAAARLGMGYSPFAFEEVKEILDTKEAYD